MKHNQSAIGRVGKSQSTSDESFSNMSNANWYLGRIFKIALKILRASRQFPRCARTEPRVVWKIIELGSAATASRKWCTAILRTASSWSSVQHATTTRLLANTWCSAPVTGFMCSIMYRQSFTFSSGSLFDPFRLQTGMHTSC